MECKKCGKDLVNMIHHPFASLSRDAEETEMK